MKHKPIITFGFAACLLMIAGTLSADTAEGFKAAVTDLTTTFGKQYPDGKKYLANLDAVDRREALLANPLISEHPILFVVRPPDAAGTHEYLGGGTFRGKGSALKLLDVKTGETKTIVENPAGHIRSPCVHFDGKRVVFAMNPKGGNFNIFERLVTPGAFAYSSLDAGRPGTKSEGWIYLLYEGGGGQMARFNLSWLLAGVKTGDGEVPKWVSQ